MHSMTYDLEDVPHRRKHASFSGGVPHEHTGTVRDPARERSPLEIMVGPLLSEGDLLIGGCVTMKLRLSPVPNEVLNVVIVAVLVLASLAILLPSDNGHISYESGPEPVERDRTTPIFFDEEVEGNFTLDTPRYDYMQGEPMDITASHNSSVNVTFVLRYPNGTTLQQRTVGTSRGRPYNEDKNTIALYHFDEGSGDTVIDSSTNGNDGTMKNGTTRTTGLLGDGLLFNGSTNYVEIPTASSLDLGNSSFTLELWFRTTTGGAVLSKTSPGDTGASISIGTGNTSSFTLMTSETSPGTLNGSSGLQDDEWHHYAAVRDPSKDQLLIYVDGVLDAVMDDVDDGSIDNEAPLYLGRDEGTDHFQGLIDEVRLSRGALVPDDMNTGFFATHSIYLPPDAPIGSYELIVSNDLDDDQFVRDIEVGVRDFIIVDDDWAGADHSDLQDAIDAASNGDIIRIYGGTYSNPLRIDKRIELAGNGTGYTTLQGSGPDDLIQVDFNGVDINNISFAGPGGQGTGVRSNANDLRIADCSFSGFATGLALNSSYGSVQVEETYDLPDVGQPMAFAIHGTRAMIAYFSGALREIDLGTGKVQWNGTFAHDPYDVAYNKDGDFAVVGREYGGYYNGEWYMEYYDGTSKDMIFGDHLEFEGITCGAFTCEFDSKDRLVIGGKGSGGGAGTDDAPTVAVYHANNGTKIWHEDDEEAFDWSVGYYDLYIDDDDDILACGRRQGSPYQARISKLDENGEVKWSKDDGSDNSGAVAVAANEEGDILLGYYEENGSFLSLYGSSGSRYDLDWNSGPLGSDVGFSMATECIVTSGSGSWIVAGVTTDGDRDIMIYVIDRYLVAPRGYRLRRDGNDTATELRISPNGDQAYLLYNGSDGARFSIIDLTTGDSGSVIERNLIDSNDNGLLIRSAGCAVQNNTITDNEKGILLDGGDLHSIYNNTISRNENGIELVNGSGNHVIKFNEIMNNTVAGIENGANGLVVVAIFNWWGDGSGPKNPDTNPTGNGNPVSKDVSFYPWLGMAGDQLDMVITSLPTHPRTGAVLTFEVVVFNTYTGSKPVRLVLQMIDADNVPITPVMLNISSVGSIDYLTRSLDVFLQREGPGGSYRWQIQLYSDLPRSGGTYITHRSGVLSVTS